MYIQIINHRRRTIMPYLCIHVPTYCNIRTLFPDSILAESSKSGDDGKSSFRRVNFS